MELIVLLGGIKNTMVSELYKKFSIGILGKLYSSIVFFVVTYIIVNYCSKEDASGYFYSFTLVNILVIFFKFGSDVIIMKSESLTADSQIDASVIANSLIYTGFLVISALLIKLLFSFDFGILVLLWALLQSVFESMIQIYRGKKEVGKFVFHLNFVNQSILLGAVFLCIKFHFLTLESIFASYSIAYGVSILMLIVSFNKKYNYINLSLNLNLSNAIERTTITAFCFVMFMISRMDLLWVEHFHNDKLADYGLASRLLSMFLIFVVVIDIVIGPITRKLYISNLKKDISEKVGVVSNVFFLFSVSLFVFSLLFLDYFVVLFFSSEYSLSSTIFNIIIVGHLVNSCLGNPGSYLLVTGRESVLTVVTFSTLLLISCLILLIGTSDVLAIAYITTLGISVNSFALVVYVKLKDGVKLYPKILHRLI